MGLLGAESGLVTITGLLWDSDVSPGTERARETNKEMRRQREAEGGRGGEGIHGGIDKDLQR